MQNLLLLTSFLFALRAAPMFILVPLYSYPGTSAAAWSNVTAAITAYPKVQWQVIINPASGPGTTVYPNSDYITAISNMNKHPNVITLGYVDTGYTKRPYASVISDINVYANWSSYSAANISIGGIFFDDVNNTASNDVYTYMQNASNYAYKYVPSDVTPVIYNPGSLAPTTLFDDCDTMIEFESPFPSYHNDTTIKTIPSSYRDQSAILATNTPATADIASLVHTMAHYGVEAVYFDATYSDCCSVSTGHFDCCYQYFDGTLLNETAAAVLAG